MSKKHKQLIEMESRLAGVADDLRHGGWEFAALIEDMESIQVRSQADQEKLVEIFDRLREVLLDIQRMRRSWIFNPSEIPGIDTEEKPWFWLSDEERLNGHKPRFWDAFWSDRTSF